MAKVDLNCDLGESFGAYTIGMDEQVIPLISSCNIACGFHASDPEVMKKTIALAKEAGIGVGAHPGFPDLMGFGRRNLNVSPKEAAAVYIEGFCEMDYEKMLSACAIEPFVQGYDPEKQADLSPE